MTTALATSASALIGNIQPFEPDNEKFSSYLERVELFLLANSIAEDKKVPVLLSVVGSKVYSLLRDLLSPKLPQTETYDTIVSTLKKHYEPKPIVIAKRFHFHRRNQANGESIAEYLAELRRLSVHCNFGTYLDEALQDRLVCGLHSKSIQRRLLEGYRENWIR